MSKALRMIFSLIMAAAVISVLPVLTGCRQSDLSGKAKTVSKETIKIGISVPLTGQIAMLGEGMKNAGLMAKAHISKNFKKLKYNYEFIFEDDQFDPKKAAAVAKKLITVDRVSAIISGEGPTAMVMGPIADKKNVIHFGITADPAAAKGDLNFLHWSPLAQQNFVFLQELKNRGYKSVGFFTNISSEVWVAIADDLKKQIKDAGIAITSDQSFESGKKDFRTLIARAKQSPAEIYILLTYSPELDIIVKQLRTAGINAPVTSIESFEFASEMPLLEGQWYVCGGNPSRDFVAEYKQRYGRYPPILSPNVYDMVNLIITAAENAESSSVPTPGQIASAMKKIDNFSGVLGKLVVRDDGIVWSRAGVKVIKNGEPALLHYYD